MTPIAESIQPTPAPRASLLIAQALVERQSPVQIASRAARLGLPLPLTRVIVAACCGSAARPPAALPARAAC